MKTYVLATLLSLAVPSYLAAQLPGNEIGKLKQQFDSDSAAALKPIVLRYAAQLDAARRAALQRGDAQSAHAAENALQQLRNSTTVPIPASPAVAAAPGAQPAPPTLDELRRRMAGTKWMGDDGGRATFAADNSVTTSWGTRGVWKIVTPRRMTIDWGKGKREDVALDADLKTYTKANGIKWHLQP